MRTGSYQGTVCAGIFVDIPQMKMCVFGSASTGRSTLLTLLDRILSVVCSFFSPVSRE